MLPFEIVIDHVLPSTSCGALAIVGPVMIVETISHLAAVAVCPTRSTTCALSIVCVAISGYTLLPNEQFQVMFATVIISFATAPCGVAVVIVMIPFMLSYVEPVTLCV